MAKDAKFDRATMLYDLLKRRPMSDKPKIIQHFRELGYENAADIIEGKNNKIPENSSSVQTATLPTVTIGTSGLPKLLEKKSTTFFISKLLSEDGGAEFQEDNSILVGILPRYELRKDLPVVKFPEYPAWKRGFNNGTMKSQQIIKNILDQWVSTNGKYATVGNLMYILKEEGLTDAFGKRIENNMQYLAEYIFINK